MIWEKLKALLGIKTKEPVVFHEEWIDILRQNVPLYAHLPEELRLRLHERIAQFIATTRFEGCGGLELTEAMILTVAAQACLLVVQREGKPYPKLSAVYLYPTTFSSVSQRRDAQGIVSEGEVHRLGESSHWGTVVLAWDSVTHGAHYIHDGDNVTFHEFAHQLDREDGPTDGAPALPSGAAYRTWSHVFHDNYADFLQRTEEGTEKVLDAYGATNPAEFFAVATETFFEKPQKLFDERPEMYTELARYYRLDPREWMEARRSASPVPPTPGSRACPPSPLADNRQEP